MNYRERLNAGLYSPDKDVRAKAEKALAKAYKVRVDEQADDAEEMNEAKVKAAEK